MMCMSAQYNPRFPHELGLLLYNGDKPVAVVAIGGGSALLSDGTTVMCLEVKNYPVVVPAKILTEDEITFEPECIEMARRAYGNPKALADSTGPNKVFPKLLELAGVVIE